MSVSTLKNLNVKNKDHSGSQDSSRTSSEESGPEP